jgi:hypothetical protein
MLFKRKSILSFIFNFLLIQNINKETMSSNGYRDQRQSCFFDINSIIFNKLIGLVFFSSLILHRHLKLFLLFLLIFLTFTNAISIAISALFFIILKFATFYQFHLIFDFLYICN